MSRMKVRRQIFSAIAYLIVGIFVVGVAYPNLAQTRSASSSLQQAKLVKIIDGDTVDIQMSKCRSPWQGNPQICRVRLACIDTPERGQNPFFENAKNRIEQLLPVGTSVIVRDTGETSYKRIVAEIFLANRSVNLQMVREGQAINYCKYLDRNCSSDRAAYISAETDAKKEGLGVWNPKQPWTQMRESHPCPN